MGPEHSDTAAWEGSNKHVHTVPHPQGTNLSNEDWQYGQHFTACNLALCRRLHSKC